MAALARPLVALATSSGFVLAIRFTDRVGKGLRGAPRDALIADSVEPGICAAARSGCNGRWTTRAPCSAR